MKAYFFNKIFRFVFLLGLLGGALDSIAQDVILLSQADVDAFDPATTVINGDLQIGEEQWEISDIFDITNLSNLTTVTGNFKVSSTENLLNLDALSNITSIGGDLNVRQNRNLANIDGLSNINFIAGSLFIFSNDILSNLDALINLTSVASDVTLLFNDRLTNLDGFTNLNSIEGKLEIRYNERLTNIDGLSNITSIGDDLFILGNERLTNIDGLSNVNSIGAAIDIRENIKLTDIDALINITSVNGYLFIEKNEKLTNIGGLSNIDSIGEFLRVWSNNNLTNLDGLSNVTFIGSFLNIRDNLNLTDCCGIRDLLENKENAIGGSISIINNPSDCSSEEEILTSGCSMKLILATSPPCIGEENGYIQVFIEYYDTIPFYYEWMRQEDGLTGNGVSESDDFTLDMLGAGTYNITVTNVEPDTAIKLDITLTDKVGYIFEIIEVKTTNSSNGQSNGSITLTTAGGTGPYTYAWSGVASGSESGVLTDSYTIPSLSYGEYLISIEDDTGASKVINISLLDETVQVITCKKPLDIVILNDVSGSVDATEYKESKQFFIDFLQEVNIGEGPEESRAGIIEWSGSSEQSLRIPITGDMTALSTYLDDSRVYSGNTAPHEAMNFGWTYLDANARTDVEKVLILSTDGSGGQISSSLIALADELKAEGYHIISIAFDDAFSNSSTRDILRRAASVDALAPGAPAYSQLDTDLAQNIVFNYLCPIDPGSSATAYFNRDGSIDITAIDPVGNCPYPDYVEVTIDISALRELSIPSGTPVTFYHNNPNLSGATSILTWLIPCAISVDSTETYTITLPMDGPSNIFAVLNDDGMQGPPINFPVTDIEEIAYSNNMDNERICLDAEATIQVFKYSSLPIPSCDTLVNYTINVCNISEVDAFGVSVMDISPPGFVLTGSIFNDNGCATDMGGFYDIPADCCFSLLLTYDAASAANGFYNDQGVELGGPADQTYFDFDGSTTTDEDVTIDGSIDCPSTTISFSKSVNIDESCDNGFVEFTFTINNEMNIPLQGLTFQDVLPAPCTWAYIPYGENGLSIANSEVIGNEAIFTIDEVQANTVATFYMDASLNSWANDGTLSNTATLENVPDVINGGFITLTSNTTNTQIISSPKITLPDTIIVNIANDTVMLEPIISTIAVVNWTTEGDGQFTDETSENTMYIIGTQDTLDGEIMLFISAESNCNETGASVLIQFEECNIKVEIIEIGACDNMGTPLDGSDDTYDVTYTVIGENIGQDSLFIISVDSYSDTLTYFTEHTLTLPVDGVEDILSFVDLDIMLCVTEIGVNQDICIEECSLIVDNLAIFNCDDNGTPQDSTDDIYQIDFTALATNSGIDSTFSTLYNGQVDGPFGYGDVTSLTLSADSVLDSILVVDSNLDTCSVWLVVNQENCYSDLPCSISIDGPAIFGCLNNGTPQDSTDDIYQIDFTAFAINSGIDSRFTTLYNGEIGGPFSYGDITSLTLSADSDLDSILVVDSNLDTCFVWIVVNQDNCYSDLPCSISLNDLTIFDCDDNGTPQDSTDDIYTVEFNVETNTNYNVIQENKIFGPFESNIQASISLSADNISDTLIFASIGSDSCFIQEVVNQNNCFKEIAVIDSSEIIIPNIFSPNGDMINDEWFVTFIGENIELLECSIYDRWGNRVYNYSETNPFWNGRYNQKEVSEGVYMYVLTYVDGSGLEKNIVGDVMVIY